MSLPLTQALTPAERTMFAKSLNVTEAEVEAVLKARAEYRAWLADRIEYRGGRENL